MNCDGNFVENNSKCLLNTTFKRQQQSLIWNDILKINYAAKCDNQNPYYDNIGESARNRFGRPYISGRPLLSCDRERIIQMFHHGIRKIEIARALGVTHSCVSKVIRR
uniref:Paired domain-containing protein n=1 Tax=Panagrolaimus sp. ES5 TaxID=591445 RepID=A0AC34F8N9_9BILA